MHGTDCCPPLAPPAHPPRPPRRPLRRRRRSALLLRGHSRDEHLDRWGAASPASARSSDRSRDTSRCRVRHRSSRFGVATDRQLGATRRTIAPRRAGATGTARRGTRPAAGSTSRRAWPCGPESGSWWCYQRLRAQIGGMAPPSNGIIAPRSEGRGRGGQKRGGSPELLRLAVGDAGTESSRSVAEVRVAGPSAPGGPGPEAPTAQEFIERRARLASGWAGGLDHVGPRHRRGIRRRLRGEVR